MDILFPDYPLQKQLSKGKCYVFDVIRKKYVLLTPEEEVRQRFIHFLMHEKGVPSAFISVEKSIVVLGLKRRYDLIVHDRAGSPLMVVECKAPSVMISQSVFDQVARYNIACRVPFVAITNGNTLFACTIDFDRESWGYLPSFPDYHDLISKV